MENLFFWGAILALLVGGTYIACTVTGSVAGGKLLRKFFERGARKVGHYTDNEERIVQLEDQVRLIARILERRVERHAATVHALQQRLEELREGEAVGTETEVEV